MIAFVLAFLPSFLPSVVGLLTKWRDTQVQLYQAKTGHAADVALAAINGQTAVQVKWWFAALPPALIGFTIAIYVMKTIAWDVVVGSLFGCHGVTAQGTCGAFITDPLRGDLHWVFITVITGYFGTVIAQQWFNSK